MTTNANSTPQVPAVALNDGATIPQLGFGVWRIPQEDAAELVGEALQVGYRHIDTAQGYENEQGVGEAVRTSGIARDQVYVTTKVHNESQGRRRSVEALEESLERLGFDHVDLYLIHWPQPSLDLYVETWEGLIEARERGLARSIGVSNFHLPHLERIISATGVVPAVNQIELHPWLTQSALVAASRGFGIQVEAWAPLARGRIAQEGTLTQIAEGLGKTIAQVVIRWHLQLEHIVFPKSATPARIAENFDVFDFELSPAEMHQISALNRDARTGANPDDF